MSLIEALQHLYPGAVHQGLITLQDDGDGPYIRTFSPALGEPPTQAELDQAELDYLPPSKLVNSINNRHPTTAELQQELTSNQSNVFNYYMAQVGKKVRLVAEDNNLMDVEEQPDGTYRRVGNMQKAAKYAQVPRSPRNLRANSLLSWEDDVWSYVEGRWAGVLGGATPPTWSELEADIDLNHPAP